MKLTNQFLLQMGGLLFIANTLLWILFGFVCFLFCGEMTTISKVRAINVEVRVCQTTDDQGWYISEPYTAWGEFCFRAPEISDGPVTTLCFLQKTGCAATEQEAYQKANATYPVGAEHRIWYGYSSDNRIYVAFNRADINMRLWLYLNFSALIFSAIFLLIPAIILIVKHYRDYQRLQEQKRLLENEGLLLIPKA